MKFMVNTITKLYEKLKEIYGDRIELIDLDENEVGVLLAKLDGILFEIKYSYCKFLRVITLSENRKVLELLRPILRKLTNDFRKHFGYDYCEDGIETANLMWDFVDPVEFKRKLLETEGYGRIVFYDGGIKAYPSILAQRKKLFKRLPEEQCLTEEKLILLERRIAASARRHDAEAALSEYYALFSHRCMGDGEEKGNSYTKK